MLEKKRMVSLLRVKRETTNQSKIVPFDTTGTQKIPSNTILLESIRPFEERLQNKGLLPPSSPFSFNPLWFLAETERNIYLWRSGKSLIEQDEFEFWVDIPKLINKRNQQLSTFEGNNPYTNPLWGLSIPSQNIIAEELEYLKLFKDAFLLIEAHANTLSRVCSMLSREINPELEALKLVILPFNITS